MVPTLLGRDGTDIVRDGTRLSASTLQGSTAPISVAARNVELRGTITQHSTVCAARRHSPPAGWDVARPHKRELDKRHALIETALGDRLIVTGAHRAACKLPADASAIPSADVCAAASPSRICGNVCRRRSLRPLRASVQAAPSLYSCGAATPAGQHASAALLAAPPRHGSPPCRGCRHRNLQTTWASGCQPPCGLVRACAAAARRPCRRTPGLATTASRMRQ